eukprot:1187647-Prorocentrum_minimum.AAC.2
MDDGGSKDESKGEISDLHELRSQMASSNQSHLGGIRATLEKSQPLFIGDLTPLAMDNYYSGFFKT